MIDFFIIFTQIKNNKYYAVTSYKNGEKYSIFPNIQYNRKVYNCNIYQLNDVITHLLFLDKNHFGSGSFGS